MKSEAAYAKAVADGAFAGMHKSQSAPDAPASFQVTLPWPSRALSPNTRIHWAPKAKAVRAARDAAFWLTWQAQGGKRPGWPAAALDVTFCPPDKRSRIEAALKQPDMFIEPPKPMKQTSLLNEDDPEAVFRKAVKLGAWKGLGIG